MRARKHTEVIILYTLLRLNYADLMIWGRHLVPDPCPESAGEVVVEEGRNSSQEMCKLEEDPLFPLCLCREHHHIYLLARLSVLPPHLPCS